IRTVVGEQPIHFSHDFHVHAFAAPLFALHQRDLAVLAQAQVDTAVCAAEASFLNSVALAPKGFANQHLELPPVHRAQAVETCLRFQQAVTLAADDQRTECGNTTDSEPCPRDRSECSAIRRVAYRSESGTA